ncbi:hypothetical protein MKZ24_02570 [Paenibacillus sp. FSL R7-0297]|uniref:RNA polymerase sigma factor n=1 Tax=unclassified Paenibacillus TaxID=185978 RepID=UPI0004F62A03|nr:hypothetical protein [Paenibacillus sp. FSL R5-0912]AIQ38964.1 hypothetical protein R50912_02060 [Paenibacillus sp. FSL R5-0912]
MRQVEAVIIRVQHGEQESFAFIVDAFQQPVYRYCCRMLGNRQDAEDEVQCRILISTPCAKDESGNSCLNSSRKSKYSSLSRQQLK